MVSDIRQAVSANSKESGIGLSAVQINLNRIID